MEPARCHPSLVSSYFATAEAAAKYCNQHACLRYTIHFNCIMYQVHDHQIPFYSIQA